MKFETLAQLGGDSARWCTTCARRSLSVSVRRASADGAEAFAAKLGEVEPAKMGGRSLCEGGGVAGGD